MAEKLDGNMSGMDAIMTMCEDNPGAMMVLMGMMQSPTGLMDIHMLDSMDIRGSHLYMPNNDCCGRDPNKFARTLMMIRSGVFSRRKSITIWKTGATRNPLSMIPSRWTAFRLMARTSVRTIPSRMSGARHRRNPMNAAVLSTIKRGHDSIDRRIKE